jgi:hypothetical protein
VTSAWAWSWHYGRVCGGEKRAHVLTTTLATMRTKARVRNTCCPPRTDTGSADKGGVRLTLEHTVLAADSAQNHGFLSMRSAAGQCCAVRESEGGGGGVRTHANAHTNGTAVGGNNMLRQAKSVRKVKNNWILEAKTRRGSDAGPM